MPIPEQRNLEEARGILAELARRRSCPARPTSRSARSAVPPSTGFSNETLLFDATWTEGGERRTERLVLRVKPTRAHRVPRVRLRAPVPRPRGARRRAADVPRPDDALVRGGRQVARRAVLRDGPRGRTRARPTAPPYTDRKAGCSRRRRPSSGARSSRAGSRRSPPCTPSTGARSASTSSTSRSTGALGFEQQLRYYEAVVRVGGRGTPDAADRGGGARVGARARAGRGSRDHARAGATRASTTSCSAATTRSPRSSTGRWSRSRTR